MRKVLFGVLAAVIVLSADAGTALAAGARCGHYFVDTNSDGICDNAGTMCAYVDEDGDGICDNCGIYHLCGADVDCGNYVDADGNGVCDNYVAGQSRGNGQGRGNGRCSQGGHRRCGR